VDTQHDELNEIESDIKATGDSLVADAKEVADLEEQKTVLPAGDPRMVELAQKSQALTAKMAAKAEVEATLVDEAQRLGATGTGEGAKGTGQGKAKGRR
jgi:hypothetical protein